MFMQYTNIPGVWYSIYLTPFSWLKNQNQYNSGEKVFFKAHQQQVALHQHPFEGLVVALR